MEQRISSVKSLGGAVAGYSETHEWLEEEFGTTPLLEHKVVWANERWMLRAGNLEISAV